MNEKKVTKKKVTKKRRYKKVEFDKRTQNPGRAKLDKNLVKDKLLTLRFTSEQMEYFEFVQELLKERTGEDVAKTALICRALEIGFSELHKKYKNLL